MNEALRELLHLKDPLGTATHVILTKAELEELCEKIEAEVLCDNPHCDNSCGDGGCCCEDCGW